MSEENFDFVAFKRKAIAGLYAGQWLDNKDGVLVPPIKEFLDVMRAEHLTQNEAADQAFAAREKAC